jgi:hypothetical protein
LIKATEYVAKILLSKGKISEDNIDKYLDLVWEVRSEVRAALLKNLDPFRMSYVLIARII